MASFPHDHGITRPTSPRIARRLAPVASLLPAALLLLTLPQAPDAQTFGPALSSPAGLFPMGHDVTSTEKNKVELPCQLRRDVTAVAQAAVAGAASNNPEQPVLASNLEPASCPPLAPLIDWYARFLNGPQVRALTPMEKAHLAARNLLSPFNIGTIILDSGFSVAIDSHSPYGPGMAGFARNAGVSFTQDMTGEFFGTFLIPSIVHQDPHYYRMPQASVRHRIAHCLYQVVWTQGDDGRGMLNYGNLVGFAIDDGIGNLYVPGQSTTFSSSTTRYFTGLATAPIDNFVIEFLPNIARHFHTRIVFVQRIIDQVARTGTTTP